MRIFLQGKLIPSLLAGLLLGTSMAASAAQCPPVEGVALQVLGSGGPIADDGRASSAYLVWHDGRARALIDVGGGAFLRFGEAGARFGDLDAILLTHLHADHSADLPALLKSGYFARRERELVLAGPTGGGNRNVQFPDLETYVSALLDRKQGAYGYLAGYLDGSDGMPLLRRVMLDAGLATATATATATAEPAVVPMQPVPLGASALQVSALAVPHGPVPAVAYRVEVAGYALVFAGDQNGRGDGVARLARDADLLILHMPVPEAASDAARALHAAPSRLGKIAAAAAPERLVLSHFMARSLENLEENVNRVRDVFKGEVTVAKDLLCIALP